MENRLHTIIKIKRRVSGEPGPPSHLAHGELAFSETGNTLYIGNSSDNISLSSTTTDLGTF